MGLITRRPQFAIDLKDIWNFIARDSEARADAFMLELSSRYETLANNPRMGAARFPKYPSIRVFPFKAYIIIYAPLANDAGIELIRLMNAARDYHRYFDR